MISSSGASLCSTKMIESKTATAYLACTCACVNVKLPFLHRPQGLLFKEYLLLLSKSTFSLGIDDPKKPDSVGELLVNLFNGGKSTTVTHGDIESTSTGIITLNFNRSAKETLLG